MRAPRNSWFAWLAMAVLVALEFVLSPYRLGIVSLILCYAVAALAQNLLAGYAGVPSLGNVVFFATGAYVAGACLSQAHAPAALAVACGVLAAGLAGLIVGLPALRVSDMQLAIVTVAVVFGAQELMKQWDAINAPSGVSVTGPPWLMDERALYVATAVIAIIGYIAVWNLLHSRSGRAIRALSANPHAALAVGIDTVRYRLIVFVLSGMLTGLAGVVYLYWAQTITPETFTLDLSLAFLTMMILGGSGSLGGSLLGAVIIGLLPQALKVLPSQIGQLNTQQSAAGLYAILLLLAVRCFPEGLWNAVAARVQRQNAGGDVLTRD